MPPKEKSLLERIRAKMKKRRKTTRTLEIAGIALLSIMIIGFLMVLYFARTVPSIEEISSRRVSQSTKIYDRTGTILLYEIQNGSRRTVVPFEAIPQSLKDATIAIEDQNFYNEPAFDWRGILRALYVDVTRGSIAQGGSTITQQLARTAFLTLNQTISRKIREFILAVKLDRFYSKDQILGLYLNEVSYGPTIAGVEEASEAYFGVPVGQINLAQSALLAALPQAPTYYSPWGTHVADLLKRKDTVLQRMYDTGKISKTDLAAARKFQIVFQPQSQGGIKAPHFVMAVQDYLVQKYGENLVDAGGLKVTTTLDWNLQQAAEKAVEDGVAKNVDLYDSHNGALVAEDPKTGQILALVGSRDYFDRTNNGNFNVAIQGLRQPGSALKPFVYLTGFELGYTPDTTLFDVPTEFSTDPSCPMVPNFSAPKNPNCFHPPNFEGVFQGPMSIRNALAQSENVPAVEMLYLVGEKRAIENANAFGLTTLNDPNSYGLSLVLGGGAVRLIDLVAAYSALAADGSKHAQSMVLKVEDPSGNILESYTDSSTIVANPQPVRLVNDILSDSEARHPLFQSSFGLTVFPGYDVALKTGTSNDYRDAWAMGYTPSLVVGVWAGNNDNSAMKRNGSSILAAIPMWSAFMKAALPLVPAETFPQPDPVSPAKPILAGNYLYGDQFHTILYYVDKNNPTGPAPANPAADPQFRNWENAALLWAASNLPNFGNYNHSVSTVSYPYGAAPAPGIAPQAPAAPSVTISAPAPGFFQGGAFAVTGKVSGPSAIPKVLILWNGAVVRELDQNFGTSSVFSAQVSPQSFNSQNLLEVRAIDSTGASGNARVILYR